MNEFNVGANVDAWRAAVGDLIRVPWRVDITQALPAAIFESFRGGEHPVH